MLRVVAHKLRLKGDLSSFYLNNPSNVLKSFKISFRYEGISHNNQAVRLNLYGESIDDLQQKYQNNNEAEDNK